jgi:hypothetical protein
MSLYPRIGGRLPPLRLSSEVAWVRLLAGKNFERQVQKMFELDLSHERDRF